MDDGVHVIDLRIKCVLVVLRYLLILLLKYSSQRHKDCKTKTSLEIGLAEIYAANEPNLKKKKSFNTDWTKLNFYDKVGTGSAAGGGAGATYRLKTKFILDELDFAVICDLLMSPDFSTLAQDKCCGSCKHDCLSCGSGKCKQTGACMYNVCSCGLDCPFIKYKVLIQIAKALRNTNAHSSFTVYENFKNRNLSFLLFPNFTKWEDIWKRIVVH